MKAILVIDEMPKNCDECLYCGKLIADGKKRGKSFTEGERRACLFVKNYIFYGFDVESGKHECCPLKPMPKRKLHEYEQVDDEYGYVEGWNDCLDAITGETE